MLPIPEEGDHCKKIDIATRFTPHQPRTAPYQCGILEQMFFRPIVAIHGVEVSQERVAEWDRRARASLSSRSSKSLKNILTVAFLVYVFALGGLQVWLPRMVPAFQGTLAKAALFVVSLLVTMLPIIWLAIHIGRRRLVTQLRLEARSDGLEVCLACGFHLSTSAKHTQQCPHCQAERVPL